MLIDSKGLSRSIISLGNMKKPWNELSERLKHSLCSSIERNQAEITPVALGYIFEG
jgi:hypothetical protein